MKRPTQGEYMASCNEYWWCLNNVAKGIARDELPYVMDMYHVVVRKQLHKMLDWYIGTLTEFAVSTGKMGRYYKKYLPAESYELYRKTYADNNYDNIWSAVFHMCHLFHHSASAVSESGRAGE